MDLDVEMKSLKLNERKRRVPSEENSTSDESRLSDTQSSPSSSPKKTLRRSTRKRIRPLEVQNYATAKLQKLPSSELVKDVTSLYLNKKIPKLHTTLETIFEEPKSAVMSSKKSKRLIDMQSTNSKLKTKKRQSRAKNLCISKWSRRKKITQELFLKKLAELDDDTEL